MLLKIIALILSLSVTGVSLLVVRQQRLQAASDMATAVERAVAADRDGWRLRTEIAARLAPDALRERLAEHAEFAPIGAEWTEIVTPGEPEAPGLSDLPDDLGPGEDPLRFPRTGALGVIQ